MSAEVVSFAVARARLNAAASPVEEIAPEEQRRQIGSLAASLRQYRPLTAEERTMLEEVGLDPDGPEAA